MTITVLMFGLSLGIAFAQERVTDALRASVVTIKGPLGIVNAWRFESNGAQIYFTGTSQHGTRITPDMGLGMGRMRGSRMTCASCHGPDGRGGDVQMMMRVIEVPDIRYETLPSEEHGGHEEEGEEGHPPYTEETIKRAITESVDPSGEPLEWPMPEWSMSDADVNDLVDFLRSLD